MKEKLYEVKLGMKVKIWKDLYIKVKAKNEKEAISKALDLDYDEYIDSEYIYDSEELITTDFCKGDGDYIKEVK